MNPHDIESPVALVVNSHHAVRRAVCERIRASFANFRIHEAASVEDARCVLATHQVDIVLLDGDASGIDAVRGTRAILEASPKATLVLLSALTEPACVSAASRAGAVAFVSKRSIGTELTQILSAFAQAPQNPRESGNL